MKAQVCPPTEFLWGRNHGIVLIKYTCARHIPFTRTMADLSQPSDTHDSVCVMAVLSTTLLKRVTGLLYFKVRFQVFRLQMLTFHFLVLWWLGEDKWLFFSRLWFSFWAIGQTSKAKRMFMYDSVRACACVYRPDSWVCVCVRANLSVCQSVCLCAVLSVCVHVFYRHT